MATLNHTAIYQLRLCEERHSKQSPLECSLFVFWNATVEHILDSHGVRLICTNIDLLSIVLQKWMLDAAFTLNFTEVNVTCHMIYDSASAVYCARDFRKKNYNEHDLVSSLLENKRCLKPLSDVLVLACWDTSWIMNHKACWCSNMLCNGFAKGMIIYMIAVRSST